MLTAPFPRATTRVGTNCRIFENDHRVSGKRDELPSENRMILSAGGGLPTIHRIAAGSLALASRGAGPFCPAARQAPKTSAATRFMRQPVWQIRRSVKFIAKRLRERLIPLDATLRNQPAVTSLPKPFSSITPKGPRRRRTDLRRNSHQKMLREVTFAMPSPRLRSRRQGRLPAGCSLADSDAGCWHSRSRGPAPWSCRRESRRAATRRWLGAPR